MVRVPQADSDTPGGQFLPAFGASEHATGRVAPFARYPVSRCAARLTGRAPRRMKQVTISDPWYNITKPYSAPSYQRLRAQVESQLSRA